MDMTKADLRIGSVDSEILNVARIMRVHNWFRKEFVTISRYDALFDVYVALAATTI
jgi:hypothetical protein